MLTLEKLGIVERTQARKTVIPRCGTKLAQKFQKQYRIADRYLQYLNLTPLTVQIKNANSIKELVFFFITQE